MKILRIPTAFHVCIVAAIAAPSYGMRSAPAVAPSASPNAKTPVVSLVSVSQPAGHLDPSLANEVNAAIDRGLNWLEANQKENGSWSDENFPALTALPLQAFADAKHPNSKAIVNKAVKYILSCVQEDGGIYRDLKDRKGGGLSNYNTAICASALQDVKDPALSKTILAARKFIASAQFFGDDVYKGGFGYDAASKRAYTDLLNTYYAVEAMAKTAGTEDKRPSAEKRVDVDWSETVKYIERMQNKPGAGEDAGGMFYNPSDPKAGARTNEQGVVVFRSYGSMTYVGMLALMHAKISRDDVRVKSAFDWSAKHWSLEENPGMGPQGLYFFYNVLTKALSAYGQELIPCKDGGKGINWRAEVAKKLVSMQSIDPKTGHGFWENKNSRYWENDKVLVTAYSLIALEMIGR